SSCCQTCRRVGQCARRLERSLFLIAEQVRELGSRASSEARGSACFSRGKRVPLHAKSLQALRSGDICRGALARRHCTAWPASPESHPLQCCSDVQRLASVWLSPSLLIR